MIKEKKSASFPFQEWDKLSQEREELHRRLQETELTARFREVLKDAQLFQEGKLTTYPIQDLLDEL